MPIAEARQILDAEYRPPIRRGDLADVPAGAVVAVIDGVFEQDLAVSPREMHDAISAGVTVVGGGSMGALRAAEVPGVLGVGRVFEWYRDGVIARDDEVALLFDPVTSRPLTVPAVNVRFAVELLCRRGTIDRTLGDALVTAALSLSYKERTYEAVLDAAGVLHRADSAGLIAMLRAHDVKRQDAQAVLEAVARLPVASAARLAAPHRRSGRCPDHIEHLSGPAERLGSELLIWETGDRVSYADLRDFLICTGVFERHARRALASIHMDDEAVQRAGDRVGIADAQSAFNTAARRWGWATSHEAKETLADLGLSLTEMTRHLIDDAKVTTLVAILARGEPSILDRALWTELFVNDLALKREAMRVGALRALAARSPGEVTPNEVAEAKAALCRVNGVTSFPLLRRRWADLGLTDVGRVDALVADLARARRSGRELVRAMSGHGEGIGPACDVPSEVQHPPLELASCPKPPGESRFCLPLSEAEQHARRLAKLIGITRIGMIGELGDLGGVQIAQAARPGNAWSSSYGGGKGTTVAGAVVGSVMEEVEKWSQEQFHPTAGIVSGSFAELQDRWPVIDPATLDLPYDTVYRPEMPLRWYLCHDLLTQSACYVPVDVLQIARSKDDISFSQRGARKHLATNGLASGFRREEAILHALCEYVERHAQRLAELLRTNPGGLGSHPFRFVDLTRARPSVRDLARCLSQQAATVRVLDITSEIRIPTFHATITRDFWAAEGFAAHPDANTAIEMALLEAAQSIATVTAGGREDMSIRVRSLGRHERPRPICVQDIWFWLDPDAVHAPLDPAAGLTSTDVNEDLTWCLRRVRSAGLRHVVVADLTPAEIVPASVVRVIIPGLETNNPFYTGPRARLTLLRDLVPRWQ